MTRPACRAFVPFALLLGFSGIAAADVSPLPNPSLPDSLAPRLVAAPDNGWLMSWLEPAGDGHALRFSGWRDGTWSEARTVASGTDWFVNWADFPAVVTHDERFWSAHWLVRRPAGGYAYDVHVSVTRDGGQSWSRPRLLHDDGTDTEHGFAVHFSHAEGAGIAWLDGRRTASGGGMTLRTAVTTRQATVINERELDDLVCDCCQTDAVAVSGGTVVVYRDRTADEIRDIYAVRQVGGQWQPPVRVAADNWTISSCPVNGPAIASGGGHVAVAWFTASGDRPRVQLARSANGAASFEPALTVADDKVVGRVRVLMLPDRSVIVSYLRAAGDGFAELRLRHVDPGGRLSPPVVAARKVRPFSVSQLARAGDAILLAWTTRDNGRSVIRTGTISLAELAPGSMDSRAQAAVTAPPARKVQPK